MKKIIGSRGIGKTTALINYAVDNMCIILAKNDDYLRERVISMGYSPMMVKHFDLENVKLMKERNLEYVVDDIDLCLESILGNNLNGYTFTIDD